MVGWSLLERPLLERLLGEWLFGERLLEELQFKQQTAQSEKHYTVVNKTMIFRKHGQTKSSARVTRQKEHFKKISAGGVPRTNLYFEWYLSDRQQHCGSECTGRRTERQQLL